MEVRADRVGTLGAEHELTVTADRTRAYAAATNDPVPAHGDGRVAPPVFAVVPVWDVIIESATGIASPEALPFAVHGEQDMVFHRPIVPGQHLRARGGPIGVHTKASGTTVVTRIETRDADDALVNEQHVVTFFRGVGASESRGEPAPGHRFPDPARADEPTAAVTQTFDDDQTFRYSEASGDLMPIHLDADFARSVGLPGIIIHGLCTMAFTSWAAVQELAEGDSSRIRRLAVRFSAPVRPGESLTTRFTRLIGRDDDGAGGYGFESISSSGATVIKDGLVVVGPALG